MGYNRELYNNYYKFFIRNELLFEFSTGKDMCFKIGEKIEHKKNYDTNSIKNFEIIGIEKSLSIHERLEYIECNSDEYGMNDIVIDRIINITLKEVG